MEEQCKSSHHRLIKSESVEVPERDLENFRRKYGDNKTHLHNIRELKVDQLNFIGFGTFSAVKKGYSHKHSQEVAVKIINLRNKQNKLYVTKYLHNEIKLWSELSQSNHSNILAMKEYITTNSFTYIVTEAICCGDLDKLIARRWLDEAKGRSLAKDVAAGVAYCHGKGIAHRDIKPANILVTRHMTLKLAGKFSLKTDFQIMNNNGKSYFHFVTSR